MDFRLRKLFDIHKFLFDGSLGTYNKGYITLHFKGTVKPIFCHQGQYLMH